MSDGDVAGFLAAAPLLEGLPEAELAELARVVRRRRLRAGERLWRQGDRGRELAFVMEGAVAASLRVPGGRAVEIAAVGPGELVGEIALLDGDGHTMSVEVTETATVLMLGRADFAALLAPRSPSAFRLRRRLALLLMARQRRQLRQLAASLGEQAGAPAADDAAPDPQLEPSGPPDSAYMRRMAAFHEFDPLALWG